MINFRIYIYKNVREIDMINTVTGPIKKEEMGVTLAHEHMLWEEQESWVSYFHKVYDED